MNLNDPQFKEFYRQRGLQGKRVSRAEAQALWAEYSGKQTAATQQATRMFTSLPEATPNATAASSAFTPEQMDYNDLDVLTGRGQQNPVIAAANASPDPQPASAQATPPADRFRGFAESQLLPQVERWRQQRDQVINGKYKTTSAQVMDLNKIDMEVETAISRLQSLNEWDAGAQSMFENATAKGGTPKVEAFYRIIDSRLKTPQGQSGVAGQTNTERAELSKGLQTRLDSLVKAAELRPDDPNIQQEIGVVTSQLASLTSEDEKKGALLSDLYNRTNELRSLRNAKKQGAPIIFRGQLLPVEDFDSTIETVGAEVNTYLSSPDVIDALPTIKMADYPNSEDNSAAWEEAVRKAGGIYKDENGDVKTADIFEAQEKAERFRRFTKERVAKDEQTEQPSIPTGDKLVIRRMIEQNKDLSNTRFSEETINRVREEMEDEEVLSALNSLYADNSWVGKLGMVAPTVDRNNMSGIRGRTENIEAATFLNTLPPEVVTRVYENANRLQGSSASAYKNEDGTWSKKVDPPEEVLYRVRSIAAKRRK